MPDRRLLVATISSALSGLLLSAFLHSNSASPNIYSDIGSFWGRSWISGGQVPYSSSVAFLEYPPVSGVILYASRVFGGAFASFGGDLYTGYYVAFCVLSFLAVAVIAWSTWRLASALGVKVNPLYFLLPTVVVYGIYNFDLFNALFIILSLQFFVEKKRELSAVSLGVAMATKFVGAVLLPIFLLELTGTKLRVRYLIITLVAAGVFFIPIALFDFGYFNQFYSYYSNWGLEDAWYLWIFWNQFSSTAKLFGLVVMALLLLRIYTLKMPVVQRSFLALSAYLLGTYIYAPQFNLMLLPLVAVLAVDSPAFYFMEVFNALIILTWFTVPSTATTGPTHAGTVPQTMALLRSASLALLGISIASKSGHSVPDWIRARLGRPAKGRQTTLPDTAPEPAL